ncbi:MAG: PQQ-binding-like beta-propeller repeat protein [Clostridia bacterium]|nr:PQQ-binding-like beta-propeller repeat protein [Clostridia bacterium]
MDRQSGISGGVGTSVHRKVNAMTGETIWQREWPASVGDTSSNGGTMTTPHVGRGSIADMVIFNQTLVPVEAEGQSVYGGRIVAYDKATGEELWRYEQAAGYWSSPVVIYDEKETAYLIQCDGSGVMRMHDPRTGGVICELDLGSRIESTPAVFNNILVVGTRGQYGRGESQKIIGVLIK